MQTLEYRTVDKSEWGPGPWQDEPDKKQWRDAATGLPCLIVRGPSGSLCGYVGVEATHAYYGKEYDDVPVEVHWGLTFASKCAPHPTREIWEKWRAGVYAGREEAKRYPIGDAARRLKDRAVELEDFDAYVRWATAAHICHLPEPGESDDVWWLGFDCAHSGDLSPAHQRFFSERGLGGRDEVYRDITFVEAETARLAAQLANCSATAPPLEDV